MHISSADKLVVVKSFAPSNPLPLDAREIYESLAEAQVYAKYSATAYAGQTIKVVEDDTVTVYTLVPSSDPDPMINYDLSFVGGGAGMGVQNVTTSTTDGNIYVSVSDGSTVSNKNIPVVGALINPQVDEDAHTLTLTKVGETPDKNSNVVIPLGGASPDTIISAVTKGDAGLTLKVTKFDVEAETETTETIDIFGAVTDIDGATAGMIDFSVKNSDGSVAHTKEALVGSVINASYNSSTKVLTLPVVTGVTGDTVNTSTVTVDMKAIVAGAFVDVTTTADTETHSAKFDFTYKDASGNTQTKTIYDSGVRKVEAGSVADKIKVTSANATTGALTSTEILVGAGSVKNPTYDADTRKITLPILQADGTTSDLAINLGKDMVVTSGTYNTDTQNIELTLTDGSMVKIAAGDLVDIYTGEATQTATVTVSDDNKISVDVKVSTDSKNMVKVDTVNGGLRVLESDFTETKEAIAQTLVDAKAYADEKAAAASTTWVDFGSEA